MDAYFSRRLDRRTFLRAGAVALGLPLLDAMIPASRGAAGAGPPARMVLLQRPFGTYYPYLFPEQAGPDYKPTRFLKLLEPHRGRFTVFSGVGHLGYPNAHYTESALFTGVGPEGLQRSDDIHNTVSLDQVASRAVSAETRVPRLVMNAPGSGAYLSWNRKGVPDPFEHSAEAVFRRLFLDGTPDEVDREVARLRHGRSILDGVRGQLAALGRDVGAADRERLEVMTGTIREAEAQLLQDEAWAKRPKPKVPHEPANFDRADHWVQDQQHWYTLIHLALQTDSTRVVVLGLGEHNPLGQPDLSIAHHDASHHGKDLGKIEQLARYEDKEYRNLCGFLSRLVGTTEAGKTLLDRTQVLFASNLGDASAHSSDNLPVLLAGGGFRHRGHLAFDRAKNYPLSNVFVRMLRQFGVPADRFGSSTGVLADLG